MKGAHQAQLPAITGSNFRRMALRLNASERSERAWKFWHFTVQKLPFEAVFFFFSLWKLKEGGGTPGEPGAPLSLDPPLVVKGVGLCSWLGGYDQWGGVEVTKRGKDVQNLHFRASPKLIVRVCLCVCIIYMEKLGISPGQVFLLAMQDILYRLVYVKQQYKINDLALI